MIAIINYNMGNVKSIANMLRKIGAETGFDPIETAKKWKY